MSEHEAAGRLAWLRPGSIPTKLGLLLTLVIGAIAAFFYLLVPAQMGDQAYQALESKAQSLAEMAAFTVRSAVIFEDAYALDDALDGVISSPDVLYVSVTSTDGRVLARRGVPERDGAGRVPGTLEAAEAPELESVHRVRVPVEWTGDTIGFVSLGMRVGEVDDQVARAREGAGFVSVLVFLTGMLAVLMGSRMVTAPLHDMVGTAQRISEGDLSERADVGSRDEVGRLGAAFNTMVDRLQEAHEALEESNRELERRVEERTKQLTESEQLLRHAQKMEAVGRLAAGIAHDFNNLLTVINGHTELSLMLADEEGPIRESLNSIATAGASASALTNQLLAFSRKQVLQPVELQVNAVVREMLQILEGLIGETVRLELDLGADVGLVEADPSQLQQVIMNLAVNAKDAMPAGGSLTIGSRRLAVTVGDELHEEGMEAGEYVEIRIQDTGQGMAENVRTRVFEPFFSTKSAGKGTGLGLSTVYGIVTQSGGNVRVESEEGVGTTFLVYLPRAVKATPSAAAPAGGEAWEGGSERILLVEDADQVRCLARRMLEREGYAVVEADCGTDALEKLEAEGGAFDLVLTDVVMPRMNGRELAEEVAERYPLIRLIFMSGYTDDEVLLAGIRDHDISFIEKPFNREILLSTVRSVLDGSVPAGSPG